MEKIKYVLNGKTKYYTREELRAYLNDLYTKNNEPSPFYSDESLDREIAKLKKYDGDPYGQFPADVRQGFHELEAAGGILVIP